MSTSQRRCRSPYQLLGLAAPGCVNWAFQARYDRLHPRRSSILRPGKPSHLGFDDYTSHSPDNVLSILPTRQTAGGRCLGFGPDVWCLTEPDSLFQIFVEKVQHQYEPVPARILCSKYENWRNERERTDSVEVAWTCVFLEIFACATQQCAPTDPDAGKDYHTAAVRLCESASDAEPCLVTLHHMLYHCLWLRSGGRLRECRKALLAAHAEALAQGGIKLF